MDKQRTVLRHMRNMRESEFGKYAPIKNKYINGCIIKRRGIFWAIKRFTRREWVKDGYLDDATWIMGNCSRAVKISCLKNLWRNGWAWKGEKII